MNRASRNADGNDSENEEDNGADEEDSSASREIPFSLHGEQSQSKTNGRANACCNQNILRLSKDSSLVRETITFFDGGWLFDSYLVERWNSAKHKSFAQREKTQKDKIQRVASSEIVAASEDYQEHECHSKCDPPHFRMLPRVHLYFRLINEKGNESHCNGELNH